MGPVLTGRELSEFIFNYCKKQGKRPYNFLSVTYDLFTQALLYCDQRGQERLTSFQRHSPQYSVDWVDIPGLARMKFHELSTCD